MENTVLALMGLFWIGIQSYTLYFAYRQRLCFLEAYFELWVPRPFKLARKLLADFSILIAINGGGYE